MRLSQLFTKTTKNHPADETSKNAQLLIQAGYVYKEMAGVLGITTNAVRTIKSRLRKKLNLEEEGSIDEMVGMI